MEEARTDRFGVSVLRVQGDIQVVFMEKEDASSISCIPSAGIQGRSRC
jgi:hypothetical protein